jgi:siroheme synthase (precorrin-2 oxidase/ferrochelatase)
MIFINYYKSDGEITAPIIVSDVEQTFDSVFGARAEEMKLIYDSITISLENTDKENSFLSQLMKNYKVDLETKRLVKKAEEQQFNIKYN